MRIEIDPTQVAETFAKFKENASFQESAQLFARGLPVLEMLLSWTNNALVRKQGRYEVVPVKEAVAGNLSLGVGAPKLGAGYQVRVFPLKYIAPTDGAFFWGMNVELGYTSRRVTENYVNTELRPILGWHSGPWLVALNPIIDAALSGEDSLSA